MTDLYTDSAIMCDIENAFWTSVGLRDWASVVQWVHGFVAVMVR